MVRQRLILLGQPVRIQLFDRGADHAVQVLAALQKERRVRDVMGQRVLEHVRELREVVFLVDQLQFLQIHQQIVQLRVDVRDAVQKSRGELAADDRRQLDRLFRL